MPAIAATPGIGARWRCRPDPRRGRYWDRASSTTATSSIGMAACSAGRADIGANPRLVGTRPLKFALPANAAGSQRRDRHPRLHEPKVQRQRDRRRHAQRALARAAADRRCAPPRALAANNRRLHCRCDRADRHAGAHRIDALVLRSFSDHKSWMIFVGIALALTAVRRSSNAIASWTDLEDLRAYAWIATWLSAPTLAAWALAWNRWQLPPSRTIDVAALALGVAGTIGAAIHSSSVMSYSRLASIALFVVIGVRIARSGPIGSWRSSLWPRYWPRCSGAS